LFGGAHKRAAASWYRLPANSNAFAMCCWITGDSFDAPWARAMPVIARSETTSPETIFILIE
jgi:hypothetical protein